MLCLCSVGDVLFHAPRRSITTLAAAQGVKTYAYLFADPQPATVSPPAFAVTHATELPYVYGDCASRSASTQALCRNIIDYWVSFAATQTPNDGKGSSRAKWDAYSATSPAVIQLKGGSTKMIADTYRAEQIGFIQANPMVHFQ